MPLSLCLVVEEEEEEHLAQVVLSLSSKGPPISPPMAAISPLANTARSRDGAEIDAAAASPSAGGSSQGQGPQVDV